jgi:2-polyprenyl-3-methyl-5-hydroxy-6-metoxy-1,4-benzoquinol methylase
MKNEEVEKEIWERKGGTSKDKPTTLGPIYSYQFQHTPRKFLFSLSRYKFAHKMIGPGRSILELGCGDGTGLSFLYQESKQECCGVDFDPVAIDWANKNFASEHLRFHCEDFFGKKYGSFGGVICFDVIAHVYPKHEGIFMQTVLDNLDDQGVFVVGTPNIEADRFVKEQFRGINVNKFSAERLVALLSKHFNHVFLFGQNDELIHTGFSGMAHYLVCVCCGKK